MLLFELIEKLKKIEKMLWSDIPVHINIHNIDQIEVFDIIIEKKRWWDYLIVLE